MVTDIYYDFLANHYVIKYLIDSRYGKTPRTYLSKKKERGIFIHLEIVFKRHFKLDVLK